MPGPSPAYHEGRPAFTGKPAQQSQLPTFEVLETYLTPVGTNAAKKKVAEIKCPRRDCGRVFMVVVKWWWDGWHGAAACPYCFKAGWRGKKP